MVNIELQRGKNGMKGEKYNKEIGATAGCTLRIVQER